MAVNWDQLRNRTRWVRHLPTVSYTDVDDTYTRTSNWRSCRQALGKVNDFKRAYRQAFKSDKLVKGHLAPVADFLLASERLATFQICNVVPQPQIHNNINWKIVERETREFVTNNPTVVSYIETGPIYCDDSKPLINNLLHVPIGMYKIVVGHNGYKLFTRVSMF